MSSMSVPAQDRDPAVEIAELCIIEFEPHGTVVWHPDRPESWLGFTHDPLDLDDCC